MLRGLVVFSLVAVGSSAHAADEILFNGKDLTGWVGLVGMRPSDGERPLADVWKVKDGTLVCTGGAGTWASLHTAKSFTNFRLRLEFRWGQIDPELAKRGGNIYNSGVFVRSSPRPAGSATQMPMTYQAQIVHTPLRAGNQSGGTGDIWISGYDHPSFQGERLPPPRPAAPAGQGASPGGAGFQGQPLPPGQAASRSFPTARFAEKPVGEWNSYEITFNGDKMTVKLNGEQVNTGSGAMVMPGRVGLECENTPIAFRNIRVTPL